MIIHNNMTELWCADISIYIVCVPGPRPLDRFNATLLTFLLRSFVFGFLLFGLSVVTRMNDRSNQQWKPHTKEISSVPTNQTSREKKTLNEIRQMRQRHFKCLQIMISLICKCRNRLRVCERASGSSMNRRMHLCVPFLLLHFFLLNFGHTEMTAPMTTLSFE